MEGGKQIFVDSNYFISFFNPDDGLHEKARDIGKNILRQKVSLVISNFIFLETVTVVSQRMERKAALQVGRELMSNPFVEVIHIDEALQRRTWEIFQKIRNEPLGAASGAVSGKEGKEGLYSLRASSAQQVARYSPKENKNISFVDCSIIACMQLEGIRKLLTFDIKDFTILQKKFSFTFYLPSSPSDETLNSNLG